MLVNRRQSLGTATYLDVFVRCGILIDPSLKTTLVIHDVQFGEEVTSEKLCTMADADFEEARTPVRPLSERLVSEVGGTEDDTWLEPSVTIPRSKSSRLDLSFHTVIVNGKRQTDLNCLPSSALIRQECSTKGRFQSGRDPVGTCGIQY